MEEAESSSKLLEDEVVSEENVPIFAFLVANNRIDCITNFAQHEQELRLTKLHLEGAAVNQVGRAALWQVAYQLGRYFGAKTLHVEGGRRTTGLYKGQVPTPFTITIPDS